MELRLHKLLRRGRSSSPESPAALDKRIATLDAELQVDEAYSLAQSTWDLRLQRLAPRIGEATETHPQRVFVAGFLYSGSGAVVDFILDHRGQRKWTPVGETRLLHAPGGIHWTISRCSEGHHKQALVDMYLHLVGMKMPAGSDRYRASWQRVNSANSRLINRDDLRSYHHACFRLLDDIASTQGALPLERIRWHTDEIFSGAQADLGAAGLVIDQAVNARRIPLSKYLAPSAFVVVHRDPRDQYVDYRDAMMKRGIAVPPAEEFASNVRKNRDRFTRAIKKAGRQGHAFVTIAFEEFVADPKLRKQLAAELGIAGPHASSRFAAEKSLKNIGIHNDLMSPRDRRLFDSAVPDFYHQMAETTVSEDPLRHPTIDQAKTTRNDA